MGQGGQVLRREGGLIQQHSIISRSANFHDPVPLAYQRRMLTIPAPVRPKSPDHQPTSPDIFGS
jgi:hypothetical protein